MTEPITFGKLEVDVVSTMEESRSVPEPETPFRVLFMGDFSGRANRGIFEPVAAMAEPTPPAGGSRQLRRGFGKTWR